MTELVILCQNFPFSHGEHLLQYEIKEHFKNFEKIILISSDTKTLQMYDIDPDVIVYRYLPKVNKNDLIRYFGDLFSYVLLGELFYIAQTYNIKHFIRLIKKVRINWW